MTSFVDGWTQVRVLGEGTYGEVRLLVSGKGEQLAMKTIDMTQTKKGVKIDDINREIRILGSVKGHPNIIHYYSHRITNDAAYIFLEFADGGELFDQIEPDVGMASQKAQSYFRELIDGLDFMHNRGIVHRDIKPENLLLTVKDSLKISDFGLATVYAIMKNGSLVERQCQSRCGTMPYAAPEILAQCSYRGPPIDVWSASVVLIAMLVGQLPWDKPTVDNHLFSAWLNKRAFDTEPWRRMGPAVIGLLSVALKPNPSERATIADIKRHPWFVTDVQRTRAQLTRQGSNVENMDMSNTPIPVHLRINANMNHGALQGMSQPQPLSPTSTNNQSMLSPPTYSSNDQSAQTYSTDQSTHSFTQPASMNSLLCANYTQTSKEGYSTQSLHPREHYVRRMTRFFVSLNEAEACAQLEAVCLQLGYNVVIMQPSQLTVSGVDRRRDQLRMKISLLRMGDKLLVDCRRSLGDGLEFKRVFVDLRQRMGACVLAEGFDWLQQCNYQLHTLTQQMHGLSQEG